MLRVRDIGAEALCELLACFALRLQIGAPGADIPGSYWGESEAGLIGCDLYVRADTPVHSVLHEACHFVCMTPARRSGLNTDAGGDYAEENAVCYLQIVLADYLDGTSRAALCADMDRWGYSFRLGSAAAWFDNDAEDALAWLHVNNLLTATGSPAWCLRGEVPAA